jgi:hypothetical protein
MGDEGGASDTARKPQGSMARIGSRGRGRRSTAVGIGASRRAATLGVGAAGMQHLQQLAGTLAICSESQDMHRSHAHRWCDIGRCDVLW